MAGSEELSRNGRRANGREQIPALEWATAILGAVLLAGALAFLTHQALVSEDRAGAITFVVKQVRPLGEGFLVEFEAHNPGRETYAEVEVEGSLRSAGGGEERARATFDYLPGRSSREGGLFFRNDPHDGELRIGAQGYRKP